MSSRSEQLLTGRKRLRGTLMPLGLLKCLIAAPAAVSSYPWRSAHAQRYSEVDGEMYLDHSMSFLRDLGVDDEVKLHAVVVHDAFQSWKTAHVSCALQLVAAEISL